MNAIFEKLGKELDELKTDCACTDRTIVVLMKNIKTALKEKQAAILEYRKAQRELAEYLAHEQELAAIESEALAKSELDIAEENVGVIPAGIKDPWLMHELKNSFTRAKNTGR